MYPNEAQSRVFGMRAEGTVNLTRKQQRRCNACIAEETEVYAEMRRKIWRK